MNNSQQYKGMKGHTFTVETIEAKVPPEANYWGFLFRVQEHESKKWYTYRALLDKETFSTKEGAAAFVQGDPMIFLKSAYLDQYENGQHPILWPVEQDGWVVC